MARGRIAKAKAEPAKKSNELLDALRFIALSQKDEGGIIETHCRIQNNYIVGFNGILACGCPITEGIDLAPHTVSFVAALEKCLETYSITQLSTEKLSVKSDKFKAIINCIDKDLMIYPDLNLPTVSVNNEIVKGFETVYNLIADNSPLVLTASALLQSGSIIATNRHVIIEYWHGFTLPRQSMLPKAALTAVIKSGKTLEFVGISDKSATFYFTDKSFIHSQLYAEKPQDFKGVLNVDCQAKPIPELFYTGLDAIAKFSEANVYFKDNLLCSHETDNMGASYEIKGLAAGPKFKIEYLKLIENLAKTIDFNGPRHALYFFGDKVRGAIAGLT